MTTIGDNHTNSDCINSNNQQLQLKYNSFEKFDHNVFHHLYYLLYNNATINNNYNCHYYHHIWTYSIAFSHFLTLHCFLIEASLS